MDACYLVVLDLLELEHQVQRLLMLGSVVVGCTWQHLSWHNRRTFRRVSNESHQRCQPQNHTTHHVSRCLQFPISLATQRVLGMLAG